MSIIIYSSRSGNTKILAEEIADVIGCNAVNLNDQDISDIDLNEIETIFLGSGVYGGKLDKKVIKFVRRLNSAEFHLKKPIRLAFFITWLGRGNSAISAIALCTKMIENEMIVSVKDSFICLGESFGLIRKGHPDKGDLYNVREWAKAVLKL